jgi:hypothetical protein
MKIRPVGAELFRADGRTDDRRDDAKSRFSQFCERAWKRILLYPIYCFLAVLETLAVDILLSSFSN